MSVRGDDPGSTGPGIGLDDDDALPDWYDVARGPGPAVGFTLFDSAVGCCGIGWGPRGVTAVQLPEDSADRVRESMTLRQPGVAEAEPPEPVAHVIERIQAVVADGADDDLADVPLDMSGLSTFLRRAYAITRTIAPGRTLTYGQIAERLGGPGLARAVGRAMGANPFPIIVPCHRVLGADGSIGGFSAHGGARTKRRMLLAEGVAEQQGPALFGTEELFPGSEHPGRERPGREADSSDADRGRGAAARGGRPGSEPREDDPAPPR